MKISLDQAAQLAGCVCAESTRHGFQTRSPWLQSSVRALLADIETPSLAVLHFAAMTAAANGEHRTPKGIIHELERFLAAQSVTVPMPPALPVWEPEPVKKATPDVVAAKCDRLRRELAARPPAQQCHCEPTCDHRNCECPRYHSKGIPA